MTPRQALEAKRAQLTGQRATQSECDAAQAALGGALPLWLMQLMVEFPLARTQFAIDDSDLKWLTLPGIEEEMTRLVPGKLLLPLGLIAVGECLQGTGDPYFIDLRTGGEDPPLVRAAHDSIRGGTYDLSGIAPVVSSLSEFFRRAEVY